MKKGDLARLESIKVKLAATLKVYKELIDNGCINGCGECTLGRIIIRDKVTYEYAGGKLCGPLSICDLLGVLSEEIVGTLSS